MDHFQIVFVPELCNGDTLESCDSVSSVFMVEAESLDQAIEKARERHTREGDGVYETHKEIETRCALRYRY